MPTGFLPDEDVGYFMIIVQGPDGVSLDYTSKVVAKVEKVVSNIPELLEYLQSADLASLETTLVMP